MTQFAKETLPISLEEEMRRSYLDYAMSVIVGRALPDARDGLKPVHRRVLFAMHVLNNDWNRAYKKSARVVGIGLKVFVSCQSWPMAIRMMPSGERALRDSNNNEEARKAGNTIPWPPGFLIHFLAAPNRASERGRRQGG